MKKEKRVYKRSFKNLVAIFVALVFLLLGVLLNCFTAYAVMKGAKVDFYLFYSLQVITNVITAGMLTFLAMSGFNKYAAQDIINTKRKKVIFGLTTFVLTMLFAMANCCCMWYMMCGVTVC